MSLPSSPPLSHSKTKQLKKIAVLEILLLDIKQIQFGDIYTAAAI